jgi:hypothetical protein
MSIESKFFIIKKNHWKHRNHFTYEIMKERAFSLEEATRKLLAYEQLNEDKDITYHLNKVDEYLTSNEEPLVLTKEVA